MNLTRTTEPLEVVDSNLAGSVFRDVNLSGGVLTDANLAGAVFDDVNLSGARFQNVNLRDATIDDACVVGLRINGILVTELLDLHAASTRSRGGTS